MPETVFLSFSDVIIIVLMYLFQDVHILAIVYSGLNTE